MLVKVLIYRIKLRGKVLLDRETDTWLSFTGRDGVRSALDADMVDLGLRAPRKARWPERARFYFTEEGWDRFGRELVRRATKRMLYPRVEKRKNPKPSEVVYQDRWQVVVIP
jgi:hypothetical protein